MARRSLEVRILNRSQRRQTARAEAVIPTRVLDIIYMPAKNAWRICIKGQFIRTAHGEPKLWATRDKAYEALVAIIQEVEAARLEYEKTK